VPATTSSAGKRKHGRTGDAGTYLKPLLIQAPGPRSAARPAAARYRRLARRFGGDSSPAAKKKAITAIAHTLLKIAYQVLKTGTPYRSRAPTSTPGGNPPHARLPGTPAPKAAPGATITITISPPEAA